MILLLEREINDNDSINLHICSYDVFLILKSNNIRWGSEPNKNVSQTFFGVLFVH